MKNKIFKGLIVLLLLVAILGSVSAYHKQNAILPCSNVTGLQGAMLIADNNQNIQKMEKAMSLIQTRNKEQLQRLDGLVFSDKDGIFMEQGRTQAKFLGFVPFNKQVTYQLHTSGGLTLEKSFFDRFWVFSNDPVLMNEVNIVTN